MHATTKFWLQYCCSYTDKLYFSILSRGIYILWLFEAYQENDKYAVLIIVFLHIKKNIEEKSRDGSEKKEIKQDW